MASEIMFGIPPGPPPVSAPPSPPNSPSGTPPATDGEEHPPLFSLAKENLDPNPRTPEPLLIERPMPRAPRKPLAPLPIGGDTEVPFTEWVCAQELPNGTLRPVPDGGRRARIPTVLESIFSRLTITTSHVSMDANAVQHGSAANGVGPRTPFSQAAMYTEKQKDDMAAEILIAQLEEGGYVCGSCGGNPEECGGTTFCEKFACKNEDEFGFRCERRAIEGENFCVGCKEGGVAWQSEPCAPGSMLMSELLEMLDDSELEEIEHERKKFKFPNHSAKGVRFNVKPEVNPLLSTTFDAFEGSFSFSSPRPVSFSSPRPVRPPPPTPVASPKLPTSPMHNLPEAKAYSLWGCSPDLNKNFSLAPNSSAARLRALNLEKELQTITAIDAALNYAPGAEPHVESYSKRNGKRKAKFSGSIYLRAADNNAGARSPYSEGDVCIWLVLDRAMGEPLINPFNAPPFNGARGRIITDREFHEATAVFIRNMRNGSDFEFLVYPDIGSIDLANLYQIWSTLASNAYENAALRHVIFYASAELRNEFVQDRWEGFLPSAIGAESIIVQEDLYPELFIVENTSHILTYVNSPTDLLQTVPISRFHNPINPIIGIGGGARPLFDFQLPPSIDDLNEINNYDDIVGWLEQNVEIDEQPSAEIINASQALNDFSTVPVVEGRKLDFLSENFRNDAQQYNALPMATAAVEVPSNLVKVTRMDNLGMIGQAVVLTDPYPPNHDPVHPKRSEIQVAQPYEPQDSFSYSSDDKFNIMHLENRPPTDDMNTVMTIYNKFRTGDAEPEQVSYMLEQIHTHFTKPHRNMTYSEEYHSAQGQITNLSRENKRLRDENETLEREFREYKIRAEASQGTFIGSQVPDDLISPPGFIRASPTPSEMLFSRTPSPPHHRDDNPRDPRSRSPPPIDGY